MKPTIDQMMTMPSRQGLPLMKFVISPILVLLLLLFQLDDFQGSCSSETTAFTFPFLVAAATGAATVSSLPSDFAFAPVSSFSTLASYDCCRGDECVLLEGGKLKVLSSYRLSSSSLNRRRAVIYAGKSAGSKYSADSTTGWDAFKDQIYDWMDSVLTFQPQQAQQAHMQARQLASSMMGTTRDHDLYYDDSNRNWSMGSISSTSSRSSTTTKTTLETIHQLVPTTTATTTTTPTTTTLFQTEQDGNDRSNNSVSIQESRKHFNEIKDHIYSFIDNTQDIYGAMLNIPQHVEQTVQEAVSVSVALGDSIQHYIVQLKAVPDKVQTFQEDVQTTLERSQRQGREVVERIQRIPSTIVKVAGGIFEWTDHVRKSTHDILSIVERKTSLQPFPVDESKSGGTADIEKKRNTSHDHNHSSHVVPMTIADIDPKLDSEVTEALRIAREVLSDESEQNSCSSGVGIQAGIWKDDPNRSRTDSTIAP